MEYTQAMYERTHNACDLPLLERSRVAVIGCGGARGYVETLARTGVGELVLIDPDVSSHANIGTQAAFRSDVGRPKVESLHDRLQDIRPELPVKLRQTRFEDLGPEHLGHLLLGAWSGREAPARTLLVLTTDSFHAQALGNRVALHFGLPSLAAQVYQNGVAAEFTFTYPGVTPACHRCALAGRYKAYVEEGFVNDVTSHGTPVFCADRVNATLGMLTLMLLHHGSDHPRWGGMLTRAGSRNLVQTEMLPNSPLGVFDRVFAGADRERVFFDHSVWLPQQPDHPRTNGYPVCPDCGGTGDLRNAVGTFTTDLGTLRKHFPGSADTEHPAPRVNPASGLTREV